MKWFKFFTFIYFFSWRNDLHFSPLAFAFISSLIHLLIQWMFLEHFLEARHWRRLLGLVVHETNEVLPSWNCHQNDQKLLPLRWSEIWHCPGNRTFTLAGILTIHKEAHTHCAKCYEKQSLAHVSHLLPVVIISIRSQPTFPSCFSMTYSEASCPLVLLNFFLDFSLCLCPHNYL